MNRRPNLLLLFPDQLRGDALGFMGNAVCRTPNFDRLAGRSVVFERHFSTFPKCMPARGSLMTGRYANTHGWRTVQQVMDRDQPNLLRTLREHGYETAVFGKNHCWHETDWDRLDHRSEDPGTVRFLEGRRALEPLQADTRGRRPAKLHSGWDYIGNGTRHRPDEAYTEQAIDFLENRRDTARPFFLQLNWESPHTVYGVEEPWFSLYDPAKLPAFPSSLPRNAPLALQAQRRWRTGADDNHAAAAEVRATYYGMVSKLDHLCGRVLATLDRLELWKDTLVVFSSDHGDYAGQYGLPEKFDTSFADCLLHVPFTLSAPGLPTGHRVGALSSLAAVAPTLADLLCLPHLPGMHEPGLLPLIEGAPGPRAVFANGGHEPEMRARFVANQRARFEANPTQQNKSAPYWNEPDCMARAQMIRTDRHKLVLSESGSHEFYDLVSDPLEMNNRWGEVGPDLIAPLMEQLVLWNLRTTTDQPRLERFTV